MMLRSFLGLPAPAKLNLFLHVLGRREDGKHLLESIFVLVDLCDTIDLVELDSGVVERTGDLESSEESDLCVRAAKALKARVGGAGEKLGVRIQVKKRIPAGAGMGGGSSDAATVLIGLNRLWKLGLARIDLEQIGEKLGADIPFFIRGVNGFVQGIGEKISPIAIPQGKYAVIWPGRGVSTAAIFSAPSLTRNTESQTIHVFSDFLRSRWPELPGCNDLQKTAAELEPAIIEAVVRLKQCPSVLAEPRMTGSGSAVFAPVRSDVSGFDACRISLPTGWRGFCVKSLEEHPLRAWSEDVEEVKLGV